MSAPSEYDATPASFVPEPTPGQVEELAERGASRLDGEAFAVAFAQLQSDTRADRDHAALVAAVLAADAPAALRDYFVQDYDLQRQLRSERHYDPDAEVWLRSSAVGGVDAPSAVSVEVAGVLVSDPLSVRVANVSRIDVVREGDAWRVRAYAWQITGDEPDFGAILQGPGWRQLS